MIQIGWLLEPVQVLTAQVRHPMAGAGDIHAGRSTPWQSIPQPGQPPTGAGRAPRGEAPCAPAMPARPHRSLGRAVAPLRPHACDGREPLWRHTTSCHAGGLESARPAPPLWGPALSHPARRSSAGDGAGHPPGMAGGSTGKDSMPPSPQRALFGALHCHPASKGLPVPCSAPAWHRAGAAAAVPTGRVRACHALAGHRDGRPAVLGCSG